MAQLQVGNHQRTHYLGTGADAAALLLRRSWVLGKEDDGRLEESKDYLATNKYFALYELQKTNADFKQSTLYTLNSALIRASYTCSYDDCCAREEDSGGSQSRTPHIFLMRILL